MPLAPKIFKKSRFLNQDVYHISTDLLSSLVGGEGRSNEEKEVITSEPRPPPPAPGPGPGPGQCVCVPARQPGGRSGDLVAYVDFRGLGQPGSLTAVLYRKRVGVSEDVTHRHTVEHSLLITRSLAQPPDFPSYCALC